MGGTHFIHPFSMLVHQVTDFACYRQFLILVYSGLQMSGLSTDIGGMVLHRLLAYLSPLPASSSTSLLSVDPRLHSKLEALFLGWVYLART